MSSLPAAYSLNPKTPSEVNRFAPVNSIQINKGSTPTLQVQLISRSALATPAQSDTESAGNLTHPEGSLIFHHDVVVSTQKITERHSALGVHILSQCGDSVADVSVTVFVEISEHDYQADYYVVVHGSKTIVWTVDQAPESFKGATQAKHEHEYWIHMENFPGPYFSTPEDLRSLKHVLGSNAIDALTSEGSTSPMSVEQIKTHLQMLDSFSGEGDVYQTYAIARLWNLILQSRVINKYGTPAARLDRFISISDNPPTFGGTYATMAKLMFNRPYIHLGRCSRAWADRIAYTEEWRKFRSTNEIEWQQVLYLSCVLVIASVILGKRSSCLFGIPAHAALLTSLASASSAYYLLTESQNLGDHAADASVYFQEREEILYGVQRIAVINATPQALLAWAFVLFVFSVFCI